MHWLLIGYMFLFIHRPFEFYPTLGDMHVERIYIGIVFIAWLFQPKKWLPNAQHIAYAGFAFGVGLCWAMSPFMEEGSQVVEDWFKILVFYVLFVTSINDVKKLRLMAIGFVVVMGVYMTHSFKEYLSGRYTYRMGIARMVGIDTSQGDPNSFGASIVFALPFAALVWKQWSSRFIKLCVILYVCLSSGCILLTGSRSSLLGLVLWGAIIICRSRRRWYGFALALIGCPILFLNLPDDLQTRFETIVNPEVGPANAKVSGEGRLEGLATGYELWMSMPATGCGPGAWRPTTHSKIESHNLYGQTMGEMGTIGVVGFGSILICYAVNLYRMKRYQRLHPEHWNDFVYDLAGAVGMGIFLMLFEGNFGHNLFRHNWLWYGGFLIIARHCVESNPVPVVTVYSTRVTVSGAFARGSPSPRIA